MRLRLFSVFFVLVFVFGMPFVLSSSVNRVVSDSNPSPGDTVTITYNVVMDQSEDYYVLNDKVPFGWALTDNGGGALGADGVWRLTVNPAVSSSGVLGYDLEVPLGANGPFAFTGSYGTVAGASTNSDFIGGDGSVSVSGTGTVVSLVPSVSAVQTGDTFTVDVYVSDAVNLYGVQFDLTFDDSLLDLEGVAHDSELLGINLGGGSVTGSDIFDPFDTQAGAIYYTPGSGIVNDFVVLRSGVTTGVTDASGKVATFTFSTSTSGNVNFALANVQLVDSEAGSLVHTTSGTSVVIGSCGDNVIQAGLGETCDDGNTDDGDGCSSVCMDISCSDSGGFVCSGGTICEGSSLASNDSLSCCSQECTLPAWNSCGECGTGLFNICDRNECENLISDSCFFTDTGISGTCSACSGASSCSDYTDDSVSCGADVCGFEPPSCSFNVGGDICEAASTELDCTDGIDNDNDGQTDCADSDCAGVEGPNPGILCCASVSDCANGECTIESCVANECTEVVRSAGDFTECGECMACNSPGGSCAPITADEGSQCTGECTYCLAGTCTDRAAHDFAECSASCEACSGLPGSTCQPDTNTQGALCGDPGKYCSEGNCCNDVNEDNVCDSCTLDEECSSPYTCAEGVCSGGSCTIDITGCNCDSVDTNLDSSWNVNDLSFIVLNPLNPRSDVDGNPGVGLGDLVFVATRIGICSP